MAHRATQGISGHRAAAMRLMTEKTAIVEALDHLESSDEELFLRGVRMTQLEPGWGGQHDTAAPVRSRCAFALAYSASRYVPSQIVNARPPTATEARRK